ncbi:transmembrane protease serine 6-like isoform X1 [Acipenser ruthenus]|uniref:transmembrane protease serine 6-like isoform X1 n=2 Tax=Acipenser ruthenus TaxID=7906 RepID=UPI002741EE8B|nr:transmembrane protease serine 6-like isoform X1 [Acipenser ruthenus]
MLQNGAADLGVWEGQANQHCGKEKRAKAINSHPKNKAPPTTKTWAGLQRICQVILPIAIVLLLAGGGALAWYILDHRLKLLEPRVTQYYTARFAVNNRDFSMELTRRESTAFKTEASKVQDVLEKILKASDLSWYYNSTTVFAFGEGSLLCYCWLVLLVPQSLADRVTAGSVSDTLLQGVGGSDGNTTAYQQGEYIIERDSLNITESGAKAIDAMKATFSCYRYASVRVGVLTSLQGPDSLRSSCLWHIAAPAGQLVKLRLEWALSECRDRLAVYDSLSPDEGKLITSLYGCSRQESVVELVSSGRVMSVVWKQGQYSYYDPFSLSAQALPSSACDANFTLQDRDGIQGHFSTPHYPSYYPPDTHCSWTFTLPSLQYGLTLWFEGYELGRANYNQACTQGQWTVQNRRLCGSRILQPYAERIHAVSLTVTLTMTSQISLTGPGVIVHYSLFNQSDPCPGQFLCSLNGLCVPSCDGITDCPNELDERNCVCTGQYRCPEDSQCLDYYKLCDHHQDCLNATDEDNCTDSVECTEFTYRCADGSCIKKPNVECDFIADCKDSSDEKHCDCGLQHISSRIVGGADSIEGEWPWQASLQVRGQHLCGGALISERWVVSAAHCFQDDSLASASVWTVYLGKFLLNRSSRNEQSFRVQEIVSHHYYDEESHDYDLALLQLDRPVAPSTLAQPACLPARTHHLQPGFKCWVTGWGSAGEGGPSSNVLQKVDVSLITQDICNQSYRYKISPRMLCAGYPDGKKDACQGDSGGPLVCKEPNGRWFLVGVVSWGIGCGRPNFYGVYTRITKMVDWIDEVTS